jgi:16S rRNA (adenine1518-N6/adenine1519-N6)-dimethyltransferase
MHQAKKQFGQHFLSDVSVVERLVRGISPDQADHMVEIGPGQGCLTDHLVASVSRLDIIEIDRDLVPLLRERYKQHAHVHVHEADALTFDFSALVQGGKSLRVVGNLPYNISSPLIFHLIDHIACIEDMHFMLQEEVVDRLAASSGSRIYGRLSVMVQCDCVVDKMFSVPPEAFDPPPKVESAVVRLRPQVRWPIEDRALFGQLVAQAFQWRRKVLRHTLKRFVSGDMLDSLMDVSGLRPEQVSVENFVRIANMVYNVMGDDQKGQ